MDVDNNTIGFDMKILRFVKNFFFFFVFLGAVGYDRWILEFWKNFGTYKVVEIYRWSTNIGKF